MSPSREQPNIGAQSEESHEGPQRSYDNLIESETRRARSKSNLKARAALLMTLFAGAGLGLGPKPAEARSWKDAIRISVRVQVGIGIGERMDQRFMYMSINDFFNGLNAEVNQRMDAERSAYNNFIRDKEADRTYVDAEATKRKSDGGSDAKATIREDRRQMNNRVDAEEEAAHSEYEARMKALANLKREFEGFREEAPDVARHGGDWRGPVLARYHQVTGE